MTQIKTLLASFQNHPSSKGWKLSGLPLVFTIIARGNTTNAQTWNTVGAAGFSAGITQYNTLAIDGSGVPYVVYEDLANGSRATVMKFNGNNWVTVGTYNAMCITTSMIAALFRKEINTG